MWLPGVPPRVGGTVRLAFVQGVKPVFELVQALQTGVRFFFVGLLKGPILQEENLSLRKEIQTLQAHEETHRQLSEENARLRSLLGFKGSVPWKCVPAQVIGRQRDLWSRMFLLDQGTVVGIRPGMPVLTPVGLVGRIADVGDSSSRAFFLNDPHFRISAMIAETRVCGLVIGTSSGDCLLTYVPLDATLKPGQRIVTSGGKSFCPGEVPIGSIQSVIQDSGSLFQSARIRPAVPLAGAEQVLIVAVPSERTIDE